MYSFKIHHINLVKVLILLVLDLLYIVLARQDCPANMIWVEVDYQSGRCCHDILCPAGSEPNVCGENDPNPTCVECSDGTYQPKPSLLSHHQWNKCRFKTNCEVIGMKYRSLGDTTIDSICECTPGYYCDHDMCLPRGRCHVGYGRDAQTGDCLPCALGKTYSDVEDVSEPCKNVTRCLRIVKPATVQSDNVCGSETSSDGGGNVSNGNGGISPVQTKNKTVVVTIKLPESQNDTLKPNGGSSDHPIDHGLANAPSNENDDSTKHHQITHILLGWVGGMVAISALVVLVTTIKCRQNIKTAKLKLKAEKAMERLDERYEKETANPEADFDIFTAALEETSAFYPNLGKALLGENRMKEFENERKERLYTFVDMIHAILDEWSQSEGERLPALALNLFNALKDAKMYETICLIDQKVTTGSNQSNDSSTPLIELQDRHQNSG